MPTRRSLLATATAVAATTLAGCSSVVGETDAEHYVDMLNGDDESHVFAVTVTDDDGGVLFDKEYDLATREGDENRVIDGSPAEITVTVDDTDPVSLPWAPRESTGSPADGCSQGTTEGLRLYYERKDGDGVTATYDCETVQDGES